MKTLNLMAIICCFLAAAQEARADIAPGPPPPPDQTLPLVVAGICHSLAIVFFGLWFVNQRKAARAKLAQSASAGSNPRIDTNQLSGSR
ncbi:MAG TPA: hypothetical protein V6C89_01335 [Drouetiella sp.]|jgi:hypothetical protein